MVNQVRIFMVNATLKIMVKPEIKAQKYTTCCNSTSFLKSSFHELTVH